MKPNCDQTIYHIYGDQILVDKAGYFGKEYFLTEKDYIPLYYVDYGVDWFTNLDKAKNELLKRFDGGDVTVVKISDDCYQLEYKEDSE